jgi:hypothetical protein
MLHQAFLIENQIEGLHYLAAYFRDVGREQEVLGDMTLVFGSIGPEDAPVSVAEAMPKNFPIPVMILARWAVDKHEQNKGIGSGLLKEALLKTLAAAEIAGLRAIVVDAINDKMAA